MIKKIAALLATVVIIGSAASVSAVHTATSHGDWYYGAIPFVWYIQNIRIFPTPNGIQL